MSGRNRKDSDGFGSIDPVNLDYLNTPPHIDLSSQLPSGSNTQPYTSSMSTNRRPRASGASERRVRILSPSSSIPVLPPTGQPFIPPISPGYDPSYLPSQPYMTPYMTPYVTPHTATYKAPYMTPYMTPGAIPPTIPGLYSALPYDPHSPIPVPFIPPTPLLSPAYFASPPLPASRSIGNSRRRSTTAAHYQPWSGAFDSNPLTTAPSPGGIVDYSSHILIQPPTPSPDASLPLPLSPTHPEQNGYTPGVSEFADPDRSANVEDYVHYGSGTSGGKKPTKNLDQYTAFWDAYNKEADIQDNELVKGLGGDLDVLLIFAGLFSATNTAFIIEAYRDLKKDPVEYTNELLQTLILNLREPLSPQSEIPSPSFVVSGRAVRVNALFFASLCCSIFAAFGAVIGKQWVTHYEREGQLRSPSERGRVRQLKYMGLKWWHLLGIVETLPTLLQFSLFFFFAALIDFLWELNVTVAAVVITFGILSFLFYVITTTIATLFPNSPFQTRFSSLLRRLFRPLLRSLQSSKPGLNPKDDTLGSHCIKWLLNTTTVPDTVTVASKAVLMLSDTAKTEVGLNETSSVLRYLFKPSIMRGRIEMGATIENVIPSLEELSVMISRWDYSRDWVLPTMESNDQFMRSFRRELLKVFFVNSFHAGAGNCVADIIKLIGIDSDIPTPYIDRLFSHILNQSFQKSSKDSTKYLWDFRSIMGAIIVLYQPLPLEHLSKLLRTDEHQLLTVLTGLDALVSITPSPRGHEVRIIHPSFTAFITTKGRCLHDNFLLDPTVHHLDLTSKCLRWILDDLKHHVENSTMSVDGHQSPQTLPSHLLYSCCYWASHLDQCPMNDPDLLDLVLEFCKTTLSYWFEALSNAGRLDVARKSLEITRRWLKNPITWTIISNPAASARMVTRLEMAERFVSDFFDQITARASNAQCWESVLMNTATSSSSDGFPEVCSEGTRTTLLEEIEDWIDDKENSPTVLMIQGSVGSGKSTIAQTVMERLSNNGCLGASIFFRRSKTQFISHPAHILGILASQLAHYYPGHRQRMLNLSCDISLERRDTFLSSLGAELRHEMKEALRAEGMARNKQAMVIVIDGIDESPDLDGLGGILELFMPLPGDSQPPAKLLITTRPEVDATSMVHSLSENLNHIRLVDLDSNYSDEAGLQYLIQQRLKNTDIDYTSINMLIDWVGTSFIVTATVSTHIVNTYPLSGTREFIEDLLQEKHDQIYKHIDSLYLEALQKLLGQNSAMELGRDVLAAITLLFDHFSIQTLSDFLEKPSDVLAAALATLRSVIVIQPSPEDTLQLLHSSLGSFLTTRCTDPSISINSGTYHSYLATRCFDHMNNFLRRDMCNIRDRTKLNWEVDGFSEKAEKAVPFHIRYACYHWASHLSFSGADNQPLVDLLNQFCTKKLLNWLEVLSLFGCLYIAEPILKRAEEWLEDKKPLGHGRISLLLQNCRQLVADYFIPISYCAPQIYDAALSLLPDCPLYETYGKGQDCSVKLISGRSESWGDQERGRSLPPIFSKDGSSILTVVRRSPSDTLRIWNIHLEEQKTELRSSLLTNNVSSAISLSPDGLLVAYATLGKDNNVVVWNTNPSPGTLVELQGHSDIVNCIGFSTDSKLVLSGSDDNTVRVWDPDSQTVTLTLSGHTDAVNAAIFSPDDKYIVSASDDCSLLIWEVAEDKYTMTLEGHQHPVTCVIISPDMTRLISGDQFGGMVLWDFEYGSRLRTCWGFPGGDSIRSAIFSQDGGRIVFWSGILADFDELSDSTPKPISDSVLQTQVESSTNSNVSWRHNSSIAPGSEDLFFWSSGWMMHLDSRGCRKLCWIPSSWHRADVKSGRAYGTIFAMVSKQGHDIVLLDLSNALNIDTSDTQMVRHVSELEDDDVDEVDRIFREVFEVPPSPSAISAVDSSPPLLEERSQWLDIEFGPTTGSGYPE